MKTATKTTKDDGNCRKATKNRRNTRMEESSYLKPAWTHNGSIRTDLPLTILGKTSKRKLSRMVAPGELCCVGKVYLRTEKGLIRIR